MSGLGLGDIITSSIHSNQSDQKLYEENHIIKKVLDLKMSAYQVFALYESLSTLENNFTNKKCKSIEIGQMFEQKMLHDLSHKAW